MALIETGKPLQKLVEVISNGIGVLYEPIRIRKKADAEAYRLEKIEEAKAKGLIIKAEANATIAERAQQRMAIQEIDRQINLESIAYKATKYLKDSVSDESVDSDWRTRFFNKAQDVSNDEMQEIWASILAEEVYKPGTISLRTLEILNNLSKSEAERFQKFCSITFPNGSHYKLGNEGYEKYGVKFEDILMLRECGLMHESDIITTIFSFFNEYGGYAFSTGKGIYLYPTEKKDEAISYETLDFTASGKELLNLLKIDVSDEYIEDFLQEMKTLHDWNFIEINEGNVKDYIRKQ